MFTVLTGGNNARHPSTFFMSRPKGLSNYVLLIIKTHADFELDGRTFVAEPGSAVLIDRNTPYHYHNPKGDYADDWLHFECTEDEYFRSSGVVFNVVFPLRNPARFSLMIQQLLWEKNYTPERYRSENINLLLQVLMNNVVIAYQESCIAHPYSPYYAKLQNVRLSLQAAPYEKYSPRYFSEQLGISISYFQHLYTTFFGIPFQSDLINMRMEYAQNLIAASNLTMEQIADICGYSNEVHFYRQFRKKTGMTPAEYRRSQTGIG